MCVKILLDNSEVPYDCNLPLEMQVVNATEVRVNYQPNDVEVEKFLQEVERCAKSGCDLKMKVKICYNDFLAGFKMKKQLRRALSDISFNEIIKLMVLTQSEADRKLEELSTICLNRELNVR